MWKHAGYRGVDAYERDYGNDQRAMLGQTDEGHWVLAFEDPNQGDELTAFDLGRHPTPELAMTAADGAMDQAHDTRLQRIDHYRLPLPHQRLQVARFNDGHPPTFYVYDHRATDGLSDIEPQDMDCRFGRTPDPKIFDEKMHRALGHEREDWGRER